MADRLAALTGEARHRKRKAAPAFPSSFCSAQQQARAPLVGTKAACSGRAQTRNMARQAHAVDGTQQAACGTQDSAQTKYDIYGGNFERRMSGAGGGGGPQQRCRGGGGTCCPAAPMRDGGGGDSAADIGSGSEVEGPDAVVDDKYIKGTRLIIGGWFQACRGCNEPTAHASPIGDRDVPLCQRCQGKYSSMVGGCFPPTEASTDPGVEPLHFWLPRLLPRTPRLSDAARRDFCDALVLRQDDAWLQLIRMS